MDDRFKDMPGFADFIAARKRFAASSKPGDVSRPISELVAEEREMRTTCPPRDCPPEQQQPVADLLKPGWSTPDCGSNPCHTDKPVVRMAVMDCDDVSLYMGCEYCGEHVADVDWPLTVDRITSEQLRELGFEIV